MTSLPPIIRIVIADDHAMILEGMISIINSDERCEVIGKALDGEQAVTLFIEHTPDVTILDLQMPKMDGIQALKAIRKIDANAKVIVLSSHDGDENIYQAIQAGAMSYVFKESLFDELNQTIKAVFAGKKVVSSDIAAKYVERTSKPILSERETEVLHYLAQGKTNGEIAGILQLTEGTIKVHVHNILEKLGVNDRTSAVILGLKRGILRL